MSSAKLLVCHQIEWNIAVKSFEVKPTSWQDFSTCSVFCPRAMVPLAVDITRTMKWFYAPSTNNLVGSCLPWTFINFHWHVLISSCKVRMSTSACGHLGRRAESLLLTGDFNVIGNIYPPRWWIVLLISNQVSLMEYIARSIWWNWFHQTGVQLSFGPKSFATRSMQKKWVWLFWIRHN